MSCRSMLPLRSVRGEWHVRKALQAPAPGLWRLRNRIASGKFKIERGGDYVTDREPDPQMIMMLADKDERIAKLEAALARIADGSILTPVASAEVELGLVKSIAAQALRELTCRSTTRKSRRR